MVVAPTVSGSFSQWAETTRIEDGLGMPFDHPASSAVQTGSSAGGGAPWLR